MAADDDLDLVAVGVLDELLIAQAVRVQRRLREEAGLGLGLGLGLG